MQISGNGSSWEYKYKSALESNAGAYATDWINKAGQADSAKTKSHAIGASDSLDSLNTDSFEYKKGKENEYNAELALAKVQDPDKYQAMLEQSWKDRTLPFRDIEKLAKESSIDGKTGTANYKGVDIQFNFFYKTMSIGNMGGENVINVGQLSNGYNFSFNLDNLDAVIEVLDIFSPEDINKIMQAITEHKMKNNMEREIEDTDALVGQLGAETEGQTVEAGSRTDAADPPQEETAQLGEIAQQSRLEDLFADQEDKTADAGGLGEAAGEEEEEKKEVTSEIVVNSDGTRNLIITTTIGDEQIITKMPLSPLKGHDEYHRQKGAEAYEEQMFTGVGVGPVGESA